MITIYTKTIIAASTCGCSDQDVEIAENEIGNYMQHITELAEAEGYEVTSEANGSGRSWYADDEDEAEFMSYVPDFWDWYQASGE